MPKTKTSFQAGHKGIGGRPKGSTNETWRKHARRSLEIGRLADKIQAELLKPERLRSMNPGQLTRLMRVVSKAQQIYLKRATHTRPLKPKRGLVITWPGNERGEQPFLDPRETPKAVAQPSTPGKPQNNTPAEQRRAINGRNSRPAKKTTRRHD